MIDLTKMIVVSSLAAGLALTAPGCGESSSPSEPSHSADDGHDHGEAGHEDHDHGPGEHEDQDHGPDEHADHDHGPGEHDDHDHEHEGHDHGEQRSLGSVTVGGATFTVSMSGDVEPGAEVHFDLQLTGGPAPAAIRLWVGDEAGTGALKSKADGHDGHFEGHAEAPSDITGASLWIEVESASGERTSGSLQLP